ncbi:MFS transporter [Kitasatospora sp. NPDC127059]|uniref:MFS transporter n=1 Tax=unclassified Kitasatospora TaxID=2633591 RepID=UPI0036536529
MKKFTALCAGYMVSMTGSALTSFALTLWIYLNTGSTIQFAVGFILSLLPGILVSPLAGALVDRWNRRTALLVSDAVGIGTTGGLALLYWAGLLHPWHVFVTIAIRSALRALQTPALNSSVVLLTPPDMLGRANGMVMIANAVGQTLAPLLGGTLLLAVKLDGVLLIDCATFVLNVIVLLLITIPDPPATEAGTAGGGTLFGEIGQGWRFLARRRGLVAVILVYAALNLGVGFVDVLFTPLVVDMSSATALGAVLSIGGVGLLVSSSLLAAWGGPRRRVHGVAGFTLILGCFLCLGALRPNIVLVGVAVFGFMFCSVIIDGTSRATLQVEVEPDMQGRTFAAFGMATNTTLFAGYLLAGPVAERVFEPLLRGDGSLAGSVGKVLGVGPGRGTAFLLLVVGAFVVLTAALGYLSPSLRSLRKPAPEPVADAGAGPTAGPEPAAEAAAPGRADDPALPTHR